MANLLGNSLLYSFRAPPPPDEPVRDALLNQVGRDDVAT